ncbi:hypothetical protein HJFPF1_13218 [Paramyrothecium foliicola]|nr:hypothetical protein HJFPF1_13218 [Paramyrothecium foliicola]
MLRVSLAAVASSSEKRCTPPAFFLVGRAYTPPRKVAVLRFAKGESNHIRPMDPKDRSTSAKGWAMAGKNGDEALEGAKSLFKAAEWERKESMQRTCRNLEISNIRPMMQH